VHLITIFASGNGSNADALCSYFAAHPHYRINCILCDKQEAGVYGIGRKHNVPVINIHTIFRDGDALLKILVEYKTDFILLAGYLKLMPAEVISKYPSRILNIHPALLPDFGGKGMYGRHVHEAVIKAGVATSGFTIHLADQQYDEGRILFQEDVLIVQNMTATALQQLVNQLELKHYAPVAEKYFDELIKNRNND
jgi:phosphoribosylglycinamide formyltransferase 1